jgi:predicted TIM-barrel fold metal-dependent hydrolase
MKTIAGKISDAPEAVTLIDAHHHLLDLSMARHPWLGDHPETGFFLGDYSSLKHNYLPADYLKDSSAHNVLATVHCEAEWARADQVGETHWISAIHARHGFPNAIIAHAWFHTQNAADILEQQAACPLVRGIRSKPVTVPSPAEKLTGVPAPCATTTGSPACRGWGVTACPSICGCHTGIWRKLLVSPRSFPIFP